MWRMHENMFGPLDLVWFTCGTKREAMSVILRTISDTADQNGAAELKPALRAKRITAEHHPGVRSQTKVILDFKKDSLSIVCSEAWLALLYIGLLHFEILTTDAAATLAGNVTLYCHSVYSALTQSLFYLWISVTMCPFIRRAMLVWSTRIMGEFTHSGAVLIVARGLRGLNLNIARCLLTTDS